MVTALLGPRMLQQRAAYSRLSTRRDRLAFLRRHAVAGGSTQGQLQADDRLMVDEPPSLRRRRSFEPRPPSVLGIRPTDRRHDELRVLAGLLPAGTVLLKVPSDQGAEFSPTPESMPAVEEEDDAPPTEKLRTLDNWTGLTYSSTVIGSESAHSSVAPPHSESQK